MVKKNIQTFDNVNTPSQIRSYLDNCKDFIIKSDNVEIKDDRLIHDVNLDVSPQYTENIGLIKSEIHSVNYFMCFLCETRHDIKDSVTVNANPFARSSFMLLCQNCYHE